MSLPPVAADRARSRSGVVLFAVALFVLSVLLQYAGAMVPQRALGAEDCDSYAIFTTDTDLHAINKNHYASKPEVYLNGGPESAGSLSAGTTLYYQVQEPDGTPLMEIRHITLDSDGKFRVQLYPFDTTSNPGGEYKVVVSTESDLSQGGCTKSDNFKVAGPGNLKVTKDVEGGPAGFSGDFAITVDCGAAGTFHTTIHFPDPGFVVIDDIDAKAECHVSEGTLPDAPAGFEWGDPTFHGNDVTIESKKTVTVGITNHLNETAAAAGSLEITKAVPEAPAGFTGTFDIHVDCGADGTFDRTIDFPDPGSVTIGDIPAGAECTVTETHGSNPPAGFTWGAVQIGGSPATITANGTAHVTVTNPLVPAGGVGGETLGIVKTNDAPMVDGRPTAHEGDTLTFTLAYTVTGTVHNATIVDTLPAGLTYVNGSATNSGTFMFQGYDAAARTLTWTAATLDASSQVTYQATVDTGATALTQPLRNVVVIDSDETDEGTDDSVVYVAPPVLGETAPPIGDVTGPPTDVAGATVTAETGAGLPLLFGLLAALVAMILLVTPAPKALKGRGRRD